MRNKFLLFSYKLSSEPSRHRVYVWRALKELGSAYLQQGVVILPYNKTNHDKLQQMHREVMEFSGIASLGELVFINEEDEKSILGEFERLRNEEYEELSENCERLVYGLDRVTQKGKISFTELEENEIEFSKLKLWFDKIAARDFFSAKGKQNSIEMLEKAEKRLQEYSLEVYKRDKNSI